MSRTNTILERVREIAMDSGARQIRQGRILQELQQVQADVARRALCIEREDTIKLKTDVATYVLTGGIYKITLILPPEDWTNTIQIVQDEKRWLEITRDSSLTGLPKFVTIWHDKLRMKPVPGSDQNNDEITLWSFGGPTVKLEDGSNPETPEHFDNALTFGTAAMILRILKNSNPKIDIGQWGSMYESELSIRRDEGLKRRSTEPLKRDHSSRTLRF